MFEKEAKERARTLEERQTLGVYDDDESYARDLGWNEGEVAGYEEGFKDGAEFGYNKAKVEIEDSYRESLCNSELNLASVTEQLEELNKANEWHFVKDNDLPKKENLECLCIIRPVREEGEHFENKDFRGVLYFRNGRFYLDEDTSNDWLKETNSDFTELVIAWKEIVLPERSE